jgi:hypothetical protein
MITCPECHKVMEWMGTNGGDHEFQRKLYVCKSCRVRCTVERQFYYDADFPSQNSEKSP